jgi:hypothetical protein
LRPGAGRQAAPRVEPIGATAARTGNRCGFADAGVAALIMALLHAGVSWFALYRPHAQIEPVAAF